MAGSSQELRLPSFVKRDGTQAYKSRTTSILQANTDAEALALAQAFVDAGELSASGANKTLEARAHGIRTKSSARMHRITSARSGRAARAQATRNARKPDAAPIHILDVALPTTTGRARSAQPVLRTQPNRAAQITAAAKIEALEAEAAQLRVKHGL